MRLCSTIALALLAAACHSKGGSTIGNQGGSGAAAPPPGASLADDVAELTRAAHDADQLSEWTQRVTFLGWTADQQVAYRVLICDPDELGGRGSYCELKVCSAGEHRAPDQAPDCADAASFELYGDIEFDAAATTAAADEAVGKLGPLTAGRPRSIDTVPLSTTGMKLTARLLDQPALTVIEAPADEEPDLGVVGATASYVGDSDDGHCRAVLGIAKYRSEYEGVHGNLPYPFAAVGCTH